MEFDRQLRHVDAPAAFEYVPEKHTLHVSDPAAALYLPGTHAVQTSATVHKAPVYPALQMQLVRVELPSFELESSGQSTH